MASRYLLSTARRNAIRSTRTVSPRYTTISMALRDDDEVRALVLTGSGNTFCAGADLSQMKGVTDEAERVRLFSSVPARRRQLVRRTMELLVNLELPTVAAVNGFAVGGGWFLALACDLRIAVEGAEFWMPEVDLGVPGPRVPERACARTSGRRAPRKSS